MFTGLLAGVVAVLDIVFNLVQLIIIASVLVSLVGADPGNPIVRFIGSVTEPLYRPIRKFTQNIPGPFDWAPLVVILLIVFLQTFLHKGLLPQLRMMGGG